MCPSVAKWMFPASLLLASVITPSHAQEQQTTTRPAIVSTSIPTDSRGETVYTFRTTDGTEPVVPGKLLDPVPMKTPKPKYPKALKKGKAAADVTVFCVITANGDVIDANVKESTDPDASASALEAVRQYRFKPATLDGKPVASLARVVIAFRIR